MVQCENCKVEISVSKVDFKNKTYPKYCPTCEKKMLKKQGKVETITQEESHFADPMYTEAKKKKRGFREEKQDE